MKDRSEIGLLSRDEEGESNDFSPEAGMLNVSSTR
jgi:hypothetical protein